MKKEFGSNSIMPPKFAPPTKDDSMRLIIKSVNR